MNPNTGSRGTALGMLQRCGGWRVVSAAFLFCLFALATAAENSSANSKDKADFLYNFSKLVEWPTNAFATADSPFVMGIAGSDDSFDKQLRQAVKGKKVGGRKVIVRQIQQPDEGPGCQLLFISQADGSHQVPFLKSVAGKSVLTVGESESFLEEGGIIRFVLIDGKVRFEIFLGAAEKAGLRISSKLLLLARPVYRPPPESRGK